MLGAKLQIFLGVAGCILAVLIGWALAGAGKHEAMPPSLSSADVTGSIDLSKRSAAPSSMSPGPVGSSPLVTKLQTPIATVLPTPSVESQLSTTAQQRGAVVDPAQSPRLSPDPASVEGSADVIDTVTLRIGNTVIRLYGTEWARGGKADDLRAYLAGRTIRCVRPERAEAFRCDAGMQDLSRVVLFNGGARASADAPAALKDAESQAKAARRGVWNTDGL